MATNKTKVVQVDMSSSSTGEDFQGQFTIKKLSIMDQTKVSSRKAALCGGLYCVRDTEGNPTGRGIDESTEFLNYMIAVLEVAVIQAPSWWDLGDISDEDVLFHVYSEVTDYQNSFRRLAGSGTGDNVGTGGSKEDSGQPNKAPVSDDNAPKMVDQEVSAALDA